MHNPAAGATPSTAGYPPGAALFSTAEKAGRSTLGQDELSSLLASLEIDFDPHQPPPPATVELRMVLSHTREFGLVISAAAGGLEAALDGRNFATGRAAAHAATGLTDADEFLLQFKRTLAYQRLAAIARRDGLAVPDAPLKDCFARLLRLAAAYSPEQVEAPYELRRLELNAVCTGERLRVHTAGCDFGPRQVRRLPRPVHKIERLIHPASIGIVGVSSSKMNFGRIILRNLLDSGYASERMVIIRDGETQIDGVRCVAGLRALEHKLDLLIVAVAATAVYGLVDEIIETDSVESVMLIPGSLGETAASREPAAALAERINAAHGKPGGGAIFLGANCLGVVSHAGHYDSWFIPLERLPKPPKKAVRNSVLVSQSGAFMITRISQNPWLDPLYMLALGNQTDLTHGDMLSYFAGRAGIETLGIYVEGFKDLDGLDFVKAVRAAVLSGQQVVVYKSGRTTAGMGGVMGHTASIAGDPALFAAVVRQAGAIVAEDFDAFDDLLYIAGALQHKTIHGNRLGAISGAGFEAIGMVDSMESDCFAMHVGSLQDATVKRVEEILLAKRLDALVEVRNPLDINPGADDEAHLLITEAFVQDPNIDAVVVGLDPTSPAVRALEASQARPGFDISDPNSIVQLLPPLVARNDKPIIGIVDGGELYDAMAAKLMDQGVCVFRNCARGTRALVRYFEARRYAESIRHRH